MASNPETTHSAFRTPTVTAARLTLYWWAAALSVYCSLIFTGFLDGQRARVLTNAAWTIASLLAAAASWNTSYRLAGSRRIAWALFAAAATAWLIGQLIWCWNVFVVGVLVPFPSLADLGFICYAVLFALGLFYFRASQPARRLAPQRLANVALILCSLAVVLDSLIVEPLVLTRRPPWFLTVVLIEGLSVAAAFVIAVNSLWSYRWRADLRPMLLIAFSLTIHGFSTLIYGQRLMLEYSTIDVVNVGWIVAFALQHGAAVLQTQGETRELQPPGVYQGEGLIEALVPALLLLFIAFTAAIAGSWPPTRAVAVQVVLLSMFALILAFREIWMHAHGQRLKGRLEQMEATLESAEQRLHRTTSDYQELQQNIDLLARAGGVGLWDWNLNTGEVQYSSEWKHQLGLEELELKNHIDEWRGRLHPDDMQIAADTLRQFLLHPDQDLSLEVRLRHRDGSYRHHLVRATLLQDVFGKPARMLTSNVDITQRKVMEIALRESEALHRTLADELEQRVARRTAELSDALRDSQNFAYAVAHDLRAPLRAMDGFSHLLQTSSQARLTQEEIAHIDRVRGGVKHMASLIDGLLAYSRVEHYPVQLERIELLALVTELMEMLESQGEMQGVRIEVRVQPTAVRADREGLRLVLRNLMDNAVKFTRGVPNPRIEIGSERKDAVALLWVKDNGVGFDQAYHDKIFGIFERLHTGEAIEGTGIGLALARKAMQRMRGRIWASAALGAGATFFIELALFDDQSEAAPA
jgi:signal transduction histidine kinase